MYFRIETHYPINRLTPNLAYSIWQTLIYEAPYATGNLRSAIKLSSNTDKRIKFVYDERQARYIDFLERGAGPVKKYRGFISNNSLNMATKDVMYWAQTRKVLHHGIPTVVVVSRKDSEATPIGYERKMLRDLGRSTTLPLSAKERSALSRSYASSGPLKNQKFGGQKPNISKSVSSPRDRFTYTNKELKNTKTKG